MKRSICQYFEVEERLPNLQPVRSPDAALTADLHFDGYFAAFREERYFLIIGYRPTSNLMQNARNAFGRALCLGTAGQVEIEEYDDREEWRRRVLQLVTPPTGGADTAGAGVSRKPKPPAPAFPFAEPWPEGAS